MSWGAIWAGVFLALVVQIMLNMLGMGVGAVSVDPRPAELQTAGWAAFAWWAIAGVIAAFAGGWLAGLLAARSGGLHGLMAWAVSAVIVIAAVGLAAGGTAGILGGIAGPSVAGYVDRNTPARAETTGARARTEAAQTAVGTMMLGSFVALLLGGAAAFAGGRLGQNPPRAVDRALD
jgi:hypothetical protein